jgi:N-acetylglucosaminyl-diphospho-decaprenol L-rhamnosyltransferase
MTTTTVATAGPHPRISVVIVSYNTRENVLRCLASLRAHLPLPHEAIVVDNASEDGTAAAVHAAYPEAVLIENAENLGFAAANNRGLARSRGAFVLVLNSDAEVRPGLVESLLERLDAHPDVGVIGPRTVDGDGVIQVSFGPPLTPLREWGQRRLVHGVKARRPAALARAQALASREHEPAWISASCLLARREALLSVNGFDEGFFLYEEDVDLCLRLGRAGWGVLYTPAAVVVHHLGRSMVRTPHRARLEYHRSHLRYYRKHNGLHVTLLLRSYLALRGLAGWVRALGSGPRRRDDRALAAAIFRLGWHGK